MSTLATALSLACCGLAACLSSSPITATGGVGGAGGTGGSTSSFNGETTSGISDPVTTGGDTTTSTDATSGPVGPGQRWNFDKGLEGWHISYSTPNDLATNATMTHAALIGSPKVGSIHLSIPFSATGQKLAVAITPMASNLTARQITAQVKLKSGIANDGKGQGVAKLYVKSGEAFVYADSGATPLTPGAPWISIPLTVSNPEGFKGDGFYDPADIREVGIEISTEGDGSYTAADLYIDSVGYD